MKITLLLRHPNELTNDPQDNFILYVFSTNDTTSQKSKAFLKALTSHNQIQLYQSPLYFSALILFFRISIF